MSDEARGYLRCLTADDSWTEEQHFSKTHKLVLGLIGGDLEQVLSENKDDIDARDALQRTPLLWAAARGDTQAVVILLSHGADVDVLDIYASPPISYAADNGHTVCVLLLLEAGANPDPKFPPGVIAPGSALNCAARNARDPLIIKYLLEYGADVDASYVDKMTALIHAARIDNTRFALLLLENHANINAVSLTQQTPLTTSIMYNSHHVLQLLLDRWDDYSECQLLQGPRLLQTTALYADIKTAKILTRSNYFKLKYDRKFTIRDFAKLLTDRADVTDELIAEFQNLLRVIGRPSSPLLSKEEREYLLEAQNELDLTAIYESEKAARDKKAVLDKGRWEEVFVEDTEEDSEEDEDEDAFHNVVADMSIS